MAVNFPLLRRQHGVGGAHAPADGAGIQEQGLSPAIHQRLVGMAEQEGVQILLLRPQSRRQQGGFDPAGVAVANQDAAILQNCLLYTSDAADE